MGNEDIQGFLSIQTLFPCSSDHAFAEEGDIRYHSERNAKLLLVPISFPGGDARNIHLGMDMNGKAFRTLCTLILILSFAGCSTYIRKSSRGYKVSRTFESDFVTTWSAVWKTLKSHPIVTADREQGIMMTDWVQGTTPLFVRREKISFLGREKSWDMGALFGNITPDTVYVIHVTDGQPADAAGLLPYDIIQEANGRKITTTLEISNIIKERPTRVTLKVLRVAVPEPFTYDVSPGLLSQSHAYSPILTRYNLKIRVMRLGERKTEVRIVSDEEGFFRPLGPDEEVYLQQQGKIRKADFQKIESSTFRERLLLDRIEMNLEK